MKNMKTAKIGDKNISANFSDKIIRQARAATIAFIKDRTGAEQHKLLGEMQKGTGRQTDVFMMPEVDGVLSFVYYTNEADKKRKEGSHIDAINIYRAVGEGIANGALSGYVTDSKLLKQIAAHKSDIAASFDPIYAVVKESPLTGGVAWKSSFPLKAMQPYYPFSGYGASLLASGYNALAAEEYYATAAINNLNAPAYEGIADALIGNTKRENTELEAVVAGNSELSSKPQVLTIAVLKYQGAYELLNNVIKTNDVENYYNYLKQNEKDLKNGQISALLTIEKMFERRDRYAAKTKAAAAML